MYLTLNFILNWNFLKCFYIVHWIIFYFPRRMFFGLKVDEVVNGEQRKMIDKIGAQYELMMWLMFIKKLVRTKWSIMTLDLPSRCSSPGSVLCDQIELFHQVWIWSTNIEHFQSEPNLANRLTWFLTGERRENIPAISLILRKFFAEMKCNLSTKRKGTENIRSDRL